MELEPDDTHAAPWLECDGHGVVTDWQHTYETPRGCWVLNSNRGSKRFYNWYETMAIAKRDGWGLGPEELKKLGPNPTPRQIRKAAVQRDFDFLHGWCNDEWQYVGVIVTLDDTDLSESLWGVESCSEDYINEVARQLADEILGPIEEEKDLATLEVGG